MPEEMSELLKNAEAYRKVIVEPVVEALEAKIQATLTPIVNKQAVQDIRLQSVESKIGTLESKWGKVLIGFLVWSTIASMVVGICIGKIRQWLHI